MAQNVVTVVVFHIKDDSDENLLKANMFIFIKSSPPSTKLDKFQGKISPSYHEHELFHVLKFCSEQGRSKTRLFIIRNLPGSCSWF